MSINDEQKRELERQIQQGLKAAKPKPSVKKSASKPDHPAGNVIYINGDGVAVGQVAGGDIHNHINEKKTVRPKVVRGSEFISAAGARKIQKRVETLVKIEVESGKTDEGKLYAKYYAMLKNHFNVPSYLEIPASQEQYAIDWLQQKKVLLRPKIRRTSNQTWRNDHYAGIWSRSKELGLSKADVYAVVKDRIGKNVVSLKNLGEQDLKHLYQIIFNMTRT
ncbi:ORF6C domain-containing protein [Methylomonas koyamae]|uniref:ORF6C domain-containing protein n=1 Tax=Methylomonas koyamae TaxID=702114 RepID=A0A291IFR4_9GAMM|nr:ORF6C domain-containing protein [Methylomonas koyamae]ATG89099.1 hypothetical protein MKLM6_0826 [Methylomonas koyamae]OAI29797.1 hypothetical protein A1356_22855 [Methylomonas koyamae]